MTKKQLECSLVGHRNRERCNRMNSRWMTGSAMFLLAMLLLLAIGQGDLLRGEQALKVRAVAVQFAVEQEEDKDHEDSAEFEDQFPNSASLKTDSDTQRVMNRAKDHSDQKRYDVAVSLYQKVLDSTRNSLITKPEWLEGDYGVQGYRSIHEEVERVLTTLPPEGLAAYRVEADGLAQGLLATAEGVREEEVLREIVLRYFVSSWGDDAGYQLGCLFLDQQNFVGAARLFDKILRVHPDSSIARSDVLLRLAVCNAKLGDKTTGKKVFAELEKMTSHAIPRSLMANVKADLASGASGSGAISRQVGGWPMELGNPTRTGNMESLPSSVLRNGLATVWTSVYSWESESQQGASVRPASKTLADISFRSGRSSSSALAGRSRNWASLVKNWKNNRWHPVSRGLLHNGMLIYRSYDRLIAIDATTGALQWESLPDPDSDLNQMLIESEQWRPQLSNMGNYLQSHDKPLTYKEAVLFGDRTLQTMAVSGDQVFYVTGSPQLPPSITNINRSMKVETSSKIDPRSKLVVIDASRKGKGGGRRRWDWSAADEKIDSASFRIIGQIIPSGNLVYVPVRVEGSLWLYALEFSLEPDANRKEMWSKKVAWKTELCRDLQKGVNNWAPVGLCMEGGDLYIASGRGVVFAVDTYSGNIRWAVRYQRTGGGTEGQSVSQPEGADQNYIVSHGRSVVVMPSDRTEIIGFDRRTGEFIWRNQIEEETSFLGIAQDHLFILKRYDPTNDEKADENSGEPYTSIVAYDLKRECLKAWAFPNDKNSGEYFSGATAKPALTEEAIYVPVKDSVLRLAIKRPNSETNPIIKLVPEGHPVIKLSAHDEWVGNLYTDGQLLLSLGPERTYGLMDAEVRLKSLDKMIEKGNFSSLWERALVHERTGNLEAAIQDLSVAQTKMVQAGRIKEARAAVVNAILQTKLAEKAPIGTLRLLSAREGVWASLTAQARKQLSQKEKSAINDALFTSLKSIHEAGGTDDGPEGRLQGSLEAVIQTIPYCDEAHLVSYGVSTMKKIATVSDVPRLREALKSKHGGLRAAAIDVLAKLEGKKFQADLTPLLSDPSDTVRLSAARGLANLGDRAALKTLVALLESKTLQSRVGAVSALRAVTAEQFGFMAYANDAEREVGVKSWQKWLAEAGKSAKLHFPFGETPYRLGRILIANPGANSIAEYTLRGERLWEATVPQPWGCQGLSNGHRLAASYTGGYVVEFDALGKEIWRQPIPGGLPYSVQRLESGNTLVACATKHQNQGLVVEIDREGKIVWKFEPSSHALDARRLPNGNTIVALANRRVEEVGRDGIPVDRQITQGSLFRPNSARPLADGQILVCDSGKEDFSRVLQFNKSGEIAWKYVDIDQPYDAVRLDNGNTLIINAQKLVEVDVQKKEVWQAPIGGRRISRY